MKSEQEMLSVPMSKIVQGENSRGDFTDSEISELMVSLRQIGQLQPIGVRPGPTAGTYEVVFGNRRFVAAQKLGWKKIDAVVVGTTGSKDSDITFLIKNASENLQRVDPSFHEQGRLFHQLIKKGLTASEIASRIGVSVARVHSIIEAFERVPRHLRDKVVLDSRGPKSGRPGQISLRSTTVAIQAIKDHALPAGSSKKIFDYAMRPASTEGKIKQVAKLMANGISFEGATKYLDSVQVISVSFLMTDAAVKDVEKAMGCKVKDAIYEFVAQSKKFPLARISPKVIVRKKA